jgi:hypothetical protein
MEEETNVVGTVQANILRFVWVEKIRRVRIRLQIILQRSEKSICVERANTLLMTGTLFRPYSGLRFNYSFWATWLARHSCLARQNGCKEMPMSVSNTPSEEFLHISISSSLWSGTCAIRRNAWLQDKTGWCHPPHTLPSCVRLHMCTVVGNLPTFGQQITALLPQCLPLSLSPRTPFAIHYCTGTMGLFVSMVPSDFLFTSSFVVL